MRRIIPAVLGLAVAGLFAVPSLAWAQGGDDGTSDLSPPELTVPAVVVFNATGPAGATVLYAVSATDNADPNPAIVCQPPSGSSFPIGTTIVTCTATDASGNSTTKSFEVVVKGADDQVRELGDRVDAFELKNGIRSALGAQLTTVQRAISAHRPEDGCGPLGAFVSLAKAQSGKQLSDGQANELIIGGTRVRAVLNCG